MCFLVGIASCQKIPPLKATLFKGHSETQEVVSKDSDVSCSSDEFNDMICMWDDDWIEEYLIRFQCEKWKPGTELIDAPKIPEIPLP